MTLVTRVNGFRRDPYPPTTVSLLTNPRSDFRSARTTRITHLNLTKPPATVNDVRPEPEGHEVIEETWRWRRAAVRCDRRTSRARAARAPGRRTDAPPAHRFESP